MPNDDDDDDDGNHPLCPSNRSHFIEVNYFTYHARFDSSQFYRARVSKVTDPREHATHLIRHIMSAAHVIFYIFCYSLPCRGSLTLCIQQHYTHLSTDVSRRLANTRSSSTLERGRAETAC